MAKGDGFWRNREKRWAVKNAEKAGIVADNLDYRKALMQRVYSGKISLEDAQKELAKTKRNAKRNGQITRAKAFREG